MIFFLSEQVLQLPTTVVVLTKTLLVPEQCLSDLSLHFPTGTGKLESTEH